MAKRAAKKPIKRMEGTAFRSFLPPLKAPKNSKRKASRRMPKLESGQGKDEACQLPVAQA